MAKWKQKRILMLADWHEASTGFGTVCRNLLRYVLLEDSRLKYEVVLVAINYEGIQYTEGNLTVVSAKDYFTPPSGQPDPFGRHSILSILSQDTIGYDLLFLFQDIGIVQPMIPTIQEIKRFKQKNNQKNFKSIFYFPVDRELVKSDVEGLDFFDQLIVYNEFSKNQVVNQNANLKKRINILPHGINAKEFYPLPKDEAKEFRDKYFGENSNKFIFCNINRNQPRKAIADTILAFEKAARYWGVMDSLTDKKRWLRKPFLYLHMLRKDEIMRGYDLDKILSFTNLVEGVDYQIADQDFFIKENGADIEILNKIYNSCDCYITTTLGEGWGLTVVEAMACGLPVIAPNHTSLSEILNVDGIDDSFADKNYSLKHRGFPINGLTRFANSIDSSVRYQSNMHDIVHAMEYVGMDNDEGMNLLKPRVIDNALSYARSLNWRSIAGRLMDIFDKTI